MIIYTIIFFFLWILLQLLILMTFEYVVDYYDCKILEKINNDFHKAKTILNNFEKNIENYKEFLLFINKFESKKIKNIENILLNEKIDNNYTKDIKKFINYLIEFYEKK